MGARAERKQRRKEKVRAYADKIEEAFYAGVDKFAGAVPTQEELNEAQMSHRRRAAELVMANPQEKELIFAGHIMFLDETKAKADELREQEEQNDRL